MKLPKRYVPDSLTEKQKKAQVKSIKEQRDRPNQEKKTKRSSHTIAFEKKYGTTIMNDSFIEKNIISKVGKDLILKKGSPHTTIAVVVHLFLRGSGVGRDWRV